MALQQTIEKGDSYEDQVVQEVRLWAFALGLQVHHVGKDNQPGDVLVVATPDSSAASALTIVIDHAIVNLRRAARLSQTFLLRPCQSEAQTQPFI